MFAYRQAEERRGPIVGAIYNRFPLLFLYINEIAHTGT